MCLQKNVSVCLNGNENKAGDGKARPKVRHWRKQQGASSEAHTLASSQSVLHERQGKRTEDDFLRRRKHVKRESDLVLVAFALQPSNQVRGV